MKEAENSLEMSRVVETGKEASRLLLKTLGGNMKKHMKAGGAKEALSFCSMNAASLTAEVDEKLGKDVSVKRITLKPRNPANLAEGDEKEVLEALEILKRNGVQLPKYLLQKRAGGYKFYKPLVINKKVCLKCHGSNIDPNLEAQIRKTYPTDKATGYKMGDLRGAIVVTIEK
ncbi:cytochrome c family protein [Hydrogenimonas sp.]|nr:cytochrome c family protein [Hydrogenimonas sp.]